MCRTPYSPTEISFPPTRTSPHPPSLNIHHGALPSVSTIHHSVLCHGQYFINHAMTIFPKPLGRSPPNLRTAFPMKSSMVESKIVFANAQLTAAEGVDDRRSFAASADRRPLASLLIIITLLLCHNHHIISHIHHHLCQPNPPQQC